MSNSSNNNSHQGATLQHLPREALEELVSHSDPFARAALRQTCSALRTALPAQPITMRQAFVRVTGSLAAHLGDKRRAHWEARAQRAIARLVVPPSAEDLIARYTTPDRAFANHVVRMRALLRVYNEDVVVPKRGYMLTVKRQRAQRQAVWRHGALEGFLRAYGVAVLQDDEEEGDEAVNPGAGDEASPEAPKIRALRLWQLLTWMLRADVTPPLAMRGAGVEDTIVPWFYTLRLRLPGPLCHSINDGTLVRTAAYVGTLSMENDRTLNLHCDEMEKSADEWRELLYLYERRLLAAGDLLRAELEAHRRGRGSPLRLETNESTSSSSGSGAAEQHGFKLLPSFASLRERFRELLLRLDGMGTV